MSILTRSLARALNTGAPIARPKQGALAAQEEDEARPLRRMGDEEEAQTLRRLPQEEKEEEEAQALRRQPEQKEEEEEAQALRRQEEQEEEEEAQALRRKEDEEEEMQARRQEEEEEAQPLRRNEDEEKDAQTLRREAEEEEEEAQTLRRQGEEEEDVQARRAPEEEEEPARTLRRQPETEEEDEELQAMSADADPENAPPLSDFDNGEEPSDLRARRLEAPGPAVGSPETGAAAGPDTNGAPLVDAPLTDPALPPTSATLQTPQQRPRVSIDQIDVVIHEEGGNSGTASGGSRDFARALRARYLGAL